MIKKVRERSKPKKYFPWNELPPELQVKILRKLNRQDLNRCRLLNRETFELIRANEFMMKRRRVDWVGIEGIDEHTIEVFMYGEANSGRWRWKFTDRPANGGPQLGSLSKGTKPFLQKQFPDAIDRLQKLAEGSDFNRFTLHKLNLSDAILKSISSCLLHAGCRTRLLQLEQLSLDAVTPPVFLKFFRRVAPVEIYFDTFDGYIQEHFGPSLWKFMVTRRMFSVSDGFDLPDSVLYESVDDDILAQLTATDFHIYSPNRITPEGLHAFLTDVVSGKRKVVKGIIGTSFPLDESFECFLCSNNIELSAGAHGVAIGELL